MEKCPFPSVWWSFPHDSHCYKLSPLQIAGWVPLVLPSLPSLFIYSLPEVLPLTHSLELGVPSPLCYMSFFFQLLVYYSVCFFLFFFPLGGWSVYSGGYADLAQGCLWEYHTLLSSLGGLHLLSRIGGGIWQHRSALDFSV
jgi:hypothetical protein